MNLAELYKIAEDNGVEVLNTSCDKSGSMSILADSGNCYIGIDNFMRESDEILHLAHELGHCITGAFYNRYSKLDVIGKHERKADNWAIKKLLTKEELTEALESGYVEIWQLAEYFDLPEEFIQKACVYYGFLEM